jgi:predicted NAD-dependent protein-ADP-ribosyltransferase YbiA (DUF1768 family)
MNYHIDWLKARFDQGETLKYIFFWGHTNKDQQEVGKFVFSQWYPAPFTVHRIQNFRTLDDGAEGFAFP